jgi:hypothetical protein
VTAPDEPPSTPSLLLSGEYEYLTDGYYECQDALEKAAKAGIAVPDWVLTHEYFPVPAVCYGVNPFSRKYAVVREESQREAAAKQLTWNFKYTICCQRISPETRIEEFRMVCGRTTSPEFGDWAARLFEIFRLPLATVRLLRNGRLELSAIEILPWRTLTPAERAFAEDHVRRLRG